MPQTAFQGESHKGDSVEGQYMVPHVEQARLVGGTTATQCCNDAAGDGGAKPGLDQHHPQRGALLLWENQLGIQEEHVA